MCHHPQPCHRSTSPRSRRGSSSRARAQRTAGEGRRFVEQAARRAASVAGPGLGTSTRPSARGPRQLTSRSPTRPTGLATSTAPLTAPTTTARDTAASTAGPGGSPTPSFLETLPENREESSRGGSRPPTTREKIRRYGERCGRAPDVDGTPDRGSPALSAPPADRPPRAPRGVGEASGELPAPRFRSLVAGQVAALVGVGVQVVEVRHLVAAGGRLPAAPSARGAGAQLPAFGAQRAPHTALAHLHEQLLPRDAPGGHRTPQVESVGLVRGHRPAGRRHDGWDEVDECRPSPAHAHATAEPGAADHQGHPVGGVVAGALVLGVAGAEVVPWSLVNTISVSSRVPCSSRSATRRPRLSSALRHAAR